MKKRIIISLVMAAALFGCKGKKGDRGDTGTTGIRGPGSIEVLTGPVTNNDFVISDSRIGQALQASVYIGAGGALTEMPYFLPAAGINAFYIGTPAQAKIEIFNAQTAGATSFVIVLTL